jgi:RNA polymerase sigma factor (sigma-70 family)
MLANSAILAANQELSDNSIIDNVLGGRREEYEILVRRYNDQLYKTARGILHDEGDVEDAMQEAFIRGFEKLHQFRKEAKFSTWLTRILINCALKQAGKLKGSKHIDIDSIAEDEIDQFQAAPADAADDEVEENLRKAIEGSIERLPSKYRVVFILREIEKVSVAETADLLGLSEENVKIRLHRAKLMLKDMLRSKLSNLEVFVFEATRCAAMAVRVMKHVASSSPDRHV